MSILVLDGNQRSALAVVRSVGRAGYDVAVGDEIVANISSSSKYAGRHIAYPSPSSRPREFQSFILNHLAEIRYDLLIPCTDKTCLLLLEIEEKVRKRVKLALPPREVFMQAFNKHLIAETALRVGIAAPKTYLIASKEDLVVACESLQFPAVLKPVQSHSLDATGWNSASVQYVYSQMDATQKYDLIDTRLPLLLQEQVIGCGCGYFALIRDGELLAESSHLRLREKPPTGGVSVLCKSIPIEAEMRHGALRLLEELSWEGLAMVEYKLERDSRKYKIMEVNGRVWGSLQLAVDSGVDFPRLMCQVHLGGACDPVGEYRTGVLGRWLLGDLDHLIAVLRRGGPRSTGTGKVWSRVAALGKFLVCFVRPTHGSVLRIADIGPWFSELRQYVKWYLKKFRAGS